MISVGAVVERLVPAAKYDGYFGNKELNPESYSDLMSRWKDDRGLPSYDAMQKMVGVIEREREVSRTLDKEADKEIESAPIKDKDMSQVDSWINEIMTGDWPEEKAVMDLIDAQSVPAETKILLKKHARATYRIIEIQKKTLRLLRALLRKVAGV